MRSSVVSDSAEPNYRTLEQSHNNVILANHRTNLILFAYAHVKALKA